MTTENRRPIHAIAGLRFERPRAWPVLITVLLVGMCVALGVWQVKRLQWKEGLIAELHAAQELRPLTNTDLPAVLEELAGRNFHPVRLRGTYRYDHEFHVIGRSSHTEEPGYHILTPLELADDGRYLLVNRGWIPQDRKDSILPQQVGEVRVQGYILVPQGGSRFLPDHDRADNIWFWQDTAAMGEASGLNLPPLVIQHVDAEQPQGAYPQAKPAFDVQLRNDHFAYSLMWFGLAISGLVIFAIYHYRPARPSE